MRNKLSLIGLLASLLLLIMGYQEMRDYYYMSRGNALFEDKKYDTAIESYSKIESDTAKENIEKVLYSKKEYGKIVEEGADGFLKGNSLIYTKSNELNEVLELYKDKMLLSEDLAIKKNYEIVLGMIEKQQDQEKQDKKEPNKEEKNENKGKQEKEESQNKEEKEQRDSNREQGENKDNKDKKENDKKDDMVDKKDNKANKSEQSDSEEKKSKEEKKEEKGSKDSSVEASQSQEEKELRAILQRLETEENQAFKNNERLLDSGKGEEVNGW